MRGCIWLACCCCAGLDSAEGRRDPILRPMQAVIRQTGRECEGERRKEKRREARCRRISRQLSGEEQYCIQYGLVCMQ